MIVIDPFSAWVIGIVIVVIVALSIWAGRQDPPNQDDDPKYYWDA